MRKSIVDAISSLVLLAGITAVGCRDNADDCNYIGTCGGPSGGSSANVGGNSGSSVGGTVGTGGMSTSGASRAGGTAAGGTASTGGSNMGGTLGTGGTTGTSASVAGGSTEGGNSTGGTSNSLGGAETGGSAVGGTGLGDTATGGLPTGGVGTGGLATGGMATGGFSSACNPTCSDTKPVCNESAATCVECLSNGNCPTSKPACNPATNACVGCMLDSYCSSPTPACKMATYTCVQCMGNGNCSAPTPACKTATNLCVQCTGNTQCSGATRACNPATNLCVQCTDNSTCGGLTPLCDTTKNTCVECLSSADCKSASASTCIAGKCEPCASNSDCSLITGKGLCKTSSLLDGDAGVDASADAGTSAAECVQCTVENETPCNGKSCNPATNACTTTTRGSRDLCYSCLADSECIGGNVASPTVRCAPMNFNGTTHGTGGYCLQTVSSTGASGCAAPYTTSTQTVSLSGAASTSYCGINESATTCEALLDLFNAKTCTLDTDCGSGSGGLCRTVGTNPNRCTIPCGSSANCLSQAPGNSCSSTSNGYCK